MGASGSTPSRPKESQHSTEPQAVSPRPGEGGVQMGGYPYPDVSTLQQVSNAYKEGTAARVLTKVAMAGAVGFVVGPFAHSGPVLASAVITSANGAAVVGFYDVLREALTSLTLSDTPVLSLVAGALTGYVWNGMVHQTRPQAVGGAMAMGVLAAVSHAALPEFDAHKFALSVLLDTGYVRDGEDGALRAHTTSPPVLAAYSHSAARAYVFGALSQLSPVREISEEEYEGIKSNNPIVISSRRKVLEDDGEPESRK